MTPPVLGVDGCRAGWVGALVADGTVEALVERRFADLVAAARGHADLAVVGVDIPIGLPDAGERAADAGARRALPGKASSVFATLVRAAYEADSYAEARPVALAASGRGASAQAYALGRKVLEVDGYVRSGPLVPVVEVHPEVSFARMTGAPIRPSKKTAEGEQRRREALRAVGLEVGGAGRGYGVDDLLDACAVAWTAARVARGEAESLPDPPEVFSDGLEAAIWV